MFHLESKKLENFGLEISDDGWTTNKFKVTNILNVKPPLFTTEVRRFITKKKLSITLSIIFLLTSKCIKYLVRRNSLGMINVIKHLHEEIG